MKIVPNRFKAKALPLKKIPSPSPALWAGTKLMANGIMPLFTKLIKIPRAIAIPKAVKAEKLVITPMTVRDSPPKPINTDLRLPNF